MRVANQIARAVRVTRVACTAFTAFILFAFIVIDRAWAQDAEIKDLTLDASPLSTDNFVLQKAAGGRALRTTRGTLRQDLSGVGTCTNQVVTVLNSDAAPTCSSITAAFITDNSILEADLKVVDTPADEECLTYETTTGDFEWQTCGGAGGASVILDLSDDGANESTAVTEIATAGDVNAFVTESSADKVLFDFTKAVPKADAFAADPVDCASGQYARGVTAAGVASGCTVDDDTPDADSEVPDAITVSGGTLSGTNSVTGVLNLDTVTEGTLRYPTSTTLPATCTLGDSYWDTDADTDGTLYVCRATNTWKDVDDDGGAGGSTNSFATMDAPDGTDPVADSATDTLDLDAGWGMTVTGNATADSLAIARRLPEDYIEVVDDFLGGTTAAGSVGSTGLSGYGALPSRSNAVTGRPGVYRMTTPATNGAVRGIGFGGAATSTVIMANEVERFMAIVRPVQNTVIEVRCGWGTDLSNTAYGTDGAYFEFDDTVSANWRLITTASSVSTTTTTAIPVAANTWVKPEVVRTSGGNIEFWLDGTLLATHTTNVPTAAVNVGCAVEPNAASIVDMDVDLYLLTAVVAR